MIFSTQYKTASRGRYDKMIGQKFKNLEIKSAFDRQLRNTLKTVV